MLDTRYNKIETFIRIKECFEFSNILVEDHALILHSTDNLFRMKIFQDKNELLAIVSYNGNKKIFGTHRFGVHFECIFPNGETIEHNVEVNTESYMDMYKRYKNICKDRADDNIENDLYFPIAYIDSVFITEIDKLANKLSKVPLSSDDEYYFRSFGFNLNITGWLVQDLSEVDANRVLIEKAYNKIQDIEYKLSGYHDIEDVSHLMSQFMKQYDICIKNYN